MSVNTVLYYEFHLCTSNIWKYVYSLRNVIFRHMMCVYILGLQETYDCAKNPKSELVKRKSFPRPATWPLDAVLCPCGPGCGALSEHMASPVYRHLSSTVARLAGCMNSCTHLHHLQSACTYVRECNYVYAFRNILNKTTC